MSNADNTVRYYQTNVKHAGTVRKWYNNVKTFFLQSLSLTAITVSKPFTREAIAYPLFLIYNKTLQSGKLPSDWKLAEVTAIYKKAQNQIQEIIDL